MSSLLNAVYFFRIIEKIFFKPLAERKKAQEDSPPGRMEVALSMLVPTLVFAAAILAFGLLNAILVKGILYKVLPPGLL